MIEIVRCEMPVVAAHRQHSNLAGQIAVRVLIDKGQLITVMQEIGQIVGMIGLNLASLIDDAVILHLSVWGWLEIRPAFLSLLRIIELWAVENFA